MQPVSIKVHPQINFKRHLQLVGHELDNRIVCLSRALWGKKKKVVEGKKIDLLNSRKFREKKPRHCQQSQIPSIWLLSFWWKKFRYPKYVYMSINEIFYLWTTNTQTLNMQKPCWDLSLVFSSLFMSPYSGGAFVQWGTTVWVGFVHNWSITLFWFPATYPIRQHIKSFSVSPCIWNSMIFFKSL